MKSLFLGFCLLNIALLFWNLRSIPVEIVQPEASGLPAILLEEELARAQRGAQISGFINKQSGIANWPDLRAKSNKPARQVFKAPIDNTRAAEPKPAEPKTPTLKCYEFGPFSDEQSAQNWLQLQHSHQGELLKKSQLVPNNFTVYYPFDKSPEQMRIVKMMLNAKGINDFWEISSGELKGALSLGVFNDLARTEVFKNQLKQRGIQVEIKERGKSQLRIFARIKSAHPIINPLDGMPPAVCSRAP